MISIAIDGPSGAGKSTLAKQIAKELKFIYVDTGALYRAVALNVLNNNCSIDDEIQVKEILKQTNVDIYFDGEEQKVVLNGKDVSPYIRTEKVSMAASAISALPAVRAFLLELQQEMGKKHNVVMDGRDIGTVVLPNADVKIFLHASAQCRAQRRYDQLVKRGEEAVFETILSDIEKRDYNDSHRAIAPLKPAEDSIDVDTSGEAVEDSFSRLMDIIKNKIRKQK